MLCETAKEPRLLSLCLLATELLIIDQRDTMTNEQPQLLPLPPDLDEAEDVNDELMGKKKSPRSSVVRRLFSGSSDSSSDDTTDFVKGKLDEIRRLQSKRWNFDFEHDRPMQDKTDYGASSSEYEWRALDSNSLPHFYHQSSTVGIHRRRLSRSGPPSSSPATMRHPPQRSSFKKLIHARRVQSDRSRGHSGSAPPSTTRVQPHKEPANGREQSIIYAFYSQRKRRLPAKDGDTSSCEHAENEVVPTSDLSKRRRSEASTINATASSSSTSGGVTNSTF